MRPIPFLSLIFVLAISSLTAYAAEKFSFEIQLIKGEISRDSNASKIALRLNGTRLVFGKTFSGYRPSSVKPVHKSFTLSKSEIAQLKQIILNSKLHEKSETIEHEFKSPAHYFDLMMTIKLDGKESKNKLRASVRDEEIKEQAIYKDTDAFLRGLFNIINKYDKDIFYPRLSY